MGLQRLGCLGLNFVLRNASVEEVFSSLILAKDMAIINR
jgi:hypothetical protein